jgi:hypothetical protein
MTPEERAENDPLKQALLQNQRLRIERNEALAQVETERMEATHKLVVKDTEATLKLEAERDKAALRTKFHIAVAVAAGIALCVASYWAGGFRAQAVHPMPDFVGNQFRPAAASAEMPAHTLATVIMYNTATEFDNKPCFCSATIIDENGLGVGCGHCFKGNIGNKFWCFRPDGKKVVATLLGHEPCGTGGDLSLFQIKKQDVLDFAPLWEKTSERPKSVDVVGYPGGSGPKHLSLGSPASSTGSQWLYSVIDGQQIVPGHSGSGIFADGKLCGVVSGYRDGGNVAATGCTYDHLVAFVGKYRHKAKCQDCENDQSQVAPPPADDGDAPPIPAPDWKPKPQSKLPSQKPIAENERHRPFPEDLNRIWKRVEAIEALQKQEHAEDADVAMLKAEYAELKKELDAIKDRPDPAPTPPAPAPQGLSAADVQKQIDAAIKKAIAGMPQPGSGQTGQAGPQGQPGKDADPAVLADINSKLALLMQGVTVQVLDRNGAVTDQDTYPPGKPIKLQNAVTPISISQKAKTTNGG